MSQRDIRSLDLGMLRTFDALMREGSVSRAAARLFLSQPAVSASLNRLRDTFGDPLFTRTSHGVLATGRAQALAPQIERVLADIAALLEADQPFNPATSQRIFRITGSDHASQRVLPALARTLTAMGSSIRIVWETPGTSPVAERLHKGDLDLAAIARIRPPRDMETLVMYEDHYVLVTRHDHPQAGHPVTMDSFCAMSHVFLGYGSSVLEDVIDETLARSGRQRPAQIAVSSFGQIIDLLQRSDHAAVIASRVAQSHADRVCAHGMPFELPAYQMLLCWDIRANGDPGVQWLKREVAQVLAGK
ncbi:MAG: LysR family transcriptional regulator [Polaromonas sp.]|uniref:LysR family transcriptional regulator n=1 Tax=Polaromonas sp. TaxID=1869339 RepID=UPI002719EC9B|nr:LysR family transcriptional regulator [Polaromonas sp.]MDO9112442.1 LysR family transcriptional regulator [Polaromonas sp.]MDP1884890.1 LysR family transcriptional regulator [Polaromonas sp.]MDP3250082.1 LysR family transcriptional regulator [Polaromonas sp.]